MSTIWLDPCLKTLCIPSALILSTSSNINTRHKAACCAGFRILLWANLSWCSKAEGPLTPASRFAVSQQPVAMVTSAQWQADAAAASRMIRPPSLNTRNCAVVTISHNPPNEMPPGFNDPHGENDRCGCVLSTHACTCVDLQFYEAVKCIGCKSENAIKLVPLGSIKHMRGC